MPLTLLPETSVEAIRTGHFRQGPDYGVLRPRGAGDFLLIYTVSGTGEVGAGDQRQPATPGIAALYHPRTPQAYRTAPHAQRWELFWAHFKPRPHLTAYLDWPEPIPGLGILQLTGQTATQVRALLTEMCRAEASGRRTGPDLALSILDQAIILAADTRPQSSIDDRVTAAMSLIARNPEAPFDIQRLARSVSLSASRLAHLFSRETGESPLQFHERQRIEKARRLLIATSQSVKEIAAACGFNSPFYFSLRFKKVTGKSPSDYRSR